MVTSIWCRDRPACNALQQRSSFSCRFVYQNPLAPISRSAATSRTVQTPKARQGHEHGFGIPSCGEPNQLAPRPYRPRGNDQSEAEATLLAAAQRSSFPVCIRPVRGRTVQTREPLIFPPRLLGDCNGRADRLWRSCPRLGIVHHAGHPSPARWNMLSIKPHVPLNTGAATWPPGLPQVACAMFLSSPKTINAMVSQGSRGSASPRHVVAFLKGPGLQRRASGSYGVTSNTSLLQWNPGNQRFVRTDVTLRTALEPTGPSKSRCQRTAWPSPYHRRDPAIEVGKSPRTD